MQRSKSRRPPLTFDEAVRYTSLTTRQLRRAVADRRIAYLKPGGRLLFLVEDLDDFLDAARVEPAASTSHLYVVKGGRR